MNPHDNDSHPFIELCYDQGFNLGARTLEVEILDHPHNTPLQAVDMAIGAGKEAPEDREPSGIIFPRGSSNSSQRAAVSFTTTALASDGSSVRGVPGPFAIP